MAARNRRHSRYVILAVVAGLGTVLAGCNRSGQDAPLPDAEGRLHVRPVSAVPAPDGGFHIQAVIAPGAGAGSTTVTHVKWGDQTLSASELRTHRASTTLVTVVDDSSAMAQSGLSPVANGLVQAVAIAIDPHNDRLGAIRFQSDTTTELSYAGAPSFVRRRGLRLAPEGPRCVNQALDRAITEADASPMAGPTVLLITSGPDAGSTCGELALDDVVARAQVLGVPIMTVQLGPENQADEGLRAASLESGGRFWTLGPTKSIDEAAALVAGQLNSTTVLSFRADAEGDVTTVEIRATADGRVLAGGLALELVGDAPPVLVALGPSSGDASTSSEAVAAIDAGSDAGDGSGETSASSVGASPPVAAGGLIAGAIPGAGGTSGLLRNGLALTAGIASGVLLAKRRRRRFASARSQQSPLAAAARARTESLHAEEQARAEPQPIEAPAKASLIAALAARLRRRSTAAAPAQPLAVVLDEPVAEKTDLTPAAKATNGYAPSEEVAGSTPFIIAPWESGDQTPPAVESPDDPGEVTRRFNEPSTLPPQSYPPSSNGVTRHIDEPEVTRPVPENSPPYPTAAEQPGDHEPVPSSVTNGAAARPASHEGHAESAPFALVGFVCGRYRLEAPLGRGGLGEVYRARDLQFDRTVAVKVLNDDRFGGADAFDSLMREVSLVDRITHHNVVRVYDVIRFEGRVAIVMEYVNGRSLAAIAADQNIIPPEEFDVVLTGVAEALDAAHAAGVVHGDVTPGNVLITEDGKVKLCDFGVGRLVGDDPTAPRAGTPRFVAPEVLDGDDAGPRADVYSLGALTLNMIAGRDGDVDLLPPHFAQVLRGALEPAPEMRCSTAGALAVGFHAAVEEELLRRRGPLRRLLDAVRGRLRSEPSNVIDVPPTVTFRMLQERDDSVPYMAEDPDRTRPLPPPRGMSQENGRGVLAAEVTRPLPDR